MPSRVGECPDQIPDSFDFHINNANPVALARIVILLILATGHDVHQEADVDLIWAVWCNCLLTWPQLQRFKAVSERLSRCDFSPYESSAFKFPESNDLESLTSIWQVWAVCKDLPSAQTVRFGRLQFGSLCYTDTDDLDILKELCYTDTDDLDLLKEGKPVRFLAHRFARTFKHEGFATPFPECEMSVSVSEELHRRYVSGMSQRGTFDSGLDSAQLNAEYAPNPSLLDPRTWQCRVPISSIPFNSFSPISYNTFCHSAIFPRYSLYMYSIGILEQQLRSFRFRSELNQLSFSFHGGDPLILALHRLPHLLTTGLQDQAVAKSAQRQERLGVFDVIHAASMVDRVGVLNVLLCCGPLLHP